MSMRGPGRLGACASLAEMRFCVTPDRPECAAFWSSVACDKMSMSTVKSENGNVSCETPEGTMVHININQRSTLDCCLDTFRFVYDMKKMQKSGQKSKPSHTTGSAAPLGFGAAYITLGLVSVMLAIIIAIIQPSMIIYYTGLHFWVGFPYKCTEKGRERLVGVWSEFIVSGILNLVTYKFPQACWVALVSLSLLMNLSVSIAGMVMAINDIQYYGWGGVDVEVCDNLLKRSDGYYRSTMPPRYYYGYDSDYYLRRCKAGLEEYKVDLYDIYIHAAIIFILGSV
ncbi:unnamed protein product [Ranitomeya imitator]|uniref:Uncharacterized protein n=1 Tax=Ranitomeya imitator TaxID=111125 RepID=A0ABN9LL48_9NEOB|nr:unnamed protein product [Ranitomeya imitator]